MYYLLYLYFTEYIFSKFCRFLKYIFPKVVYTEIVLFYNMLYIYKWYNFSTIFE